MLTVTTAERGNVVTLAAQVRGGKQSAAATVEAHLDRLLSHQSTLNAVIATRVAGARADALRIDRTIAAGGDPGPLAGVPFTVKDVIATADLPTTCGSRSMAGHRAGHDATVVARLREAGAVLIGKTNTPEFAFGIDTVNELYGRTVNPVGPFTVGGSSGGEAASVASGISAFGIGTDFGGSLRWPAQCTGLVGLRPTVGRVPGTGQLPAAGSDAAVPDVATLQRLVQVIGPLTSSVGDAFAVLSVIAGPDGLDLAATSQPLIDPRSADLSRVEIRWGTTVAGVTSHPAVESAVRLAADVLDKISSVWPGLPSVIDDAVSLYADLRMADPLTEVRRAIGTYHRSLDAAGVGAFVQELLRRAPEPDAERMHELLRQRAFLCDELESWLHSDRLLLLPVALDLPFDVDSNTPKPGLDPGTAFNMLGPCRAISLFGLPSVSVPLGRSPQGRPLSVQIVAPAGRESLALAAAQLLESEEL